MRIYAFMHSPARQRCDLFTLLRIRSLSSEYVYSNGTVHNRVATTCSSVQFMCCERGFSWSFVTRRDRFSAVYLEDAKRLVECSGYISDSHHTLLKYALDRRRRSDERPPPPPPPPPRRLTDRHTSSTCRPPS